MKRQVLWCALVAACGALARPPEPNRRLEIHTAGSIFASDRGYVLAVLPEPQATVIQLDVRYPVGSANDPPGKEGLAHLVEHMLFAVEYTHDDHTTSIAAELSRLAIGWNAETAADYTDYQTVANPTALHDLLALEADRLALGCGGLTEAIFEREREVVLNELRQNLGTSASLRRALFEAVYPEGHPYRRVDSVASVSKLQLADVCAFLADEYQRGPALVVVSGAVDETAVRNATKVFDRLRKRAPASDRIPAPLVPRHELVRVKADVDQPIWFATFPLPPMSSREYRALEMVWPAIGAWGGGWNSWWGYDSSTFVIGGAYAPVLVSSITLISASKADEAKDELRRSIDGALRGVYYNGDDTRDSLHWALRWHAWATDLIARWESLAGRNELAANILTETADTSLLIGRIKELGEMSPKSTRALAEKWLSPDRARYVLVEPSGEAATRNATKFAPTVESPGVMVDGSLADRPLPIPTPRSTLPPDRYKLDNGLTVVLWPYGHEPVVHGRLVIAAGNAQDPVGAEGVADLAGADTVTADSLTFSDVTMTPDVDRLVRTLAAELRSPGYGLSDSGKAYLKVELQKKGAREAVAYRKQLLTAVYGAGHPYARPGMTEDSVDNLHHDLVIGWARDHVVPSNAVLIVTGDFDVDVVEKHIAYDAGPASSGDRSNPVELAPHGLAGPQYVRGVQSKPSPTVELDMMFQAGVGIDADYAKRLVLEAVLDAQLERLRGSDAVTYGFSASYVIRRAGGMWEIAGRADASRAREAGRAFAKIVAEMRRDPESYRASFVLARQKVIDRLLASATDSDAMADRLALQALFDLPDELNNRLAAQVAQLTLATFHPFVSTDLALGRQVIGAFGNADAVDAALAGALGR
ncbi:MAG TPA: insulinase family protein [Kofleriaceae bacterium]|jgi:zinc protease